jgi:hypothetical protein
LTESPGPVRGWRRGGALLLVALLLSVTSTLPLIAAPFLLLALVMGTRRISTLVVAGLAVVVLFGSADRGSVWYLERGWAVLLAGWFVSLTLVRPSSRFFGRALASTVGAFLIAGPLLGSRPGAWGRVDWQIRQSLMEGVQNALAAFQVLQAEGAGPPGALVAAVVRTAEQQGYVFPALLALSSLGALGVAWWLYVRLAWGSGRGLGPLREFRFNDHLVWFFLAGLAVLVLGLGDAWARAGVNTVVFMGTLYALRGAAVVAFLTGGLSIMGATFLGLAILFVGPLLVGGALIIGLGDTWFDVRTRAEKAKGPKS